MPVAFQCRGCGCVKPKSWVERCNECGGFFNIRQVNQDIEGAEAAEPIEGEVISLEDAIKHVVIVPRLETGIAGIDYVLGGGFAHNSVSLLCGDAGSGKSTLILQVFQSLAKLRHDVIFITGEQSVNDIAIRAQSFGKFPARMVACRENDLDAILDIAEDRHPAMVCIDSAQTLFVDDELEVGGAMSIKVAIREVMRFAKDQNIAFLVIGHITKGGAIGGPKALEHFVDVNLYFARGQGSTRILRCDSKNRYGEVPRKAEFEMSENGLRDLTNIIPIRAK